MYEITPKEFETLMLIIQGKTNKAIANTLRVSLKTTERHVENLLSKTYCKSRAKLASLYFYNFEKFVVIGKAQKRQKILNILKDEYQKISSKAIARKAETSVSYVNMVIKDFIRCE